MTRSERRAIYVAEAAAKHGVNADDILGRSRRWKVVRARREVMRRYRDEARYSLSAIGAVFGRHHTTVWLAIRTAEKSA